MLNALRTDLFDFTHRWTEALNAWETCGDERALLHAVLERMHIPANALIDTAGLTPHTKPVSTIAALKLYVYALSNPLPH